MTFAHYQLIRDSHIDYDRLRPNLFWDSSERDRACLVLTYIAFECNAASELSRSISEVAGALSMYRGDVSKALGVMLSVGLISCDPEALEDPEDVWFTDDGQPWLSLQLPAVS